jgi:hypothetical protein
MLSTHECEASLPDAMTQNNDACIALVSHCKADYGHNLSQYVKAIFDVIGVIGPSLYLGLCYMVRNYRSADLQHCGFTVERI